MIQANLRIVSHEQLNEDSWRLTLEAPQIANEVKPGQFINVKNIPLDNHSSISFVV